MLCLPNRAIHRNRTGRSALDVEDSALGRYGVAISRAVELEFQRNCVRHRDYITPGFLTVRFYVESTGKVRSVHLDGDMSTGEIQKGFTLNSIRNAEIPSMPKSLGREYAKEPLELWIGGKLVAKALTLSPLGLTAF